VAGLNGRFGFINDTKGDAVVEAAILFPIIIMIFAALVLTAIYLPQRAILQEAAQIAAVAIATERSDTWMAFSDNGDKLARHNQPRLPNVYVDFFRGVFYNRTAGNSKAQSLVQYLAARGIVRSPGGIEIEYNVVNYIIYQEVVITVRQTIPMPVNLSFIGFPADLELTQEARAVVQNGDEFVRNLDIAHDLVLWIAEKFGGSETFGGALGKITDVGRWFGF